MTPTSTSSRPTRRWSGCVGRSPTSWSPERAPWRPKRPEHYPEAGRADALPGARGSAGGREVWAVPGSLTANVLDGEAGGRGIPSVSLDLSLRGLEQRDRRVL